MQSGEQIDKEFRKFCVQSVCFHICNVKAPNLRLVQIGPFLYRIVFGMGGKEVFENDTIFEIFEEIGNMKSLEIILALVLS